jgi:protein-S-isoprenylcysteine O-methyltransferase Ste14
MDADPLFVIGGCAFAVLVLGWLVVSFSAPSRKRTVVEWIAATAMYAVLFLLFAHLVRNAIEDDSTVRLVAFGFLCVLFAGGLVVGLYQTFAALKSDGDSGTSATN